MSSQSEREIHMLEMVSRHLHVHMKRNAFSLDDNLVASLARCSVYIKQLEGTSYHGINYHCM